MSTVLTIRRVFAAAARSLVACGLLATLGCATPLTVPVETHPASNPFLLPVGMSQRSFETTWERCIDVLHQYKFEIARENRAAGMIETEYKVGASLLEPWHPDSVDTRSRLESTFQSIRRKVIVRIIRDDGGAGYLVGVEALKEREDTGGTATTSRGQARFNEYSSGEDDYSKAIRGTEFSGWIPLGHDVTLERDLIQSLQIELTR